MKKRIILISVILILVACSESDKNLIVTSPIEEDFSSIIDPKERWEAYDLTNYYIDQNWSCECLPPYYCKSFITNNNVAFVNFNISNESYFGRSKDEVYNYAMNAAMTVNEAFNIIDFYKPTAHRINVEYDSKFGFPTKIYIDIDSLIADDEIIRRFSNLQKIVK